MSATQQKVAGLILIVIVAVVFVAALVGNTPPSRPTDAQCRGVGYTMPVCKELAEREFREGWRKAQGH